ncbi:MAG: hypothetical protein WHS65_05325 [Melioribacteraceae bacterium]
MGLLSIFYQGLKRGYREEMAKQKDYNPEEPDLFDKLEYTYSVLKEKFQEAEPKPKQHARKTISALRENLDALEKKLEE